jgi:DNA-binding FadR family transcriptional regulator
LVGPAATPATRDPTSDANGGSKLASQVARRIIADLAAAGWPRDQIVGSEPELLERYGVSRAVFREAIRLVEHLHVARMRRGPGGGLLVMDPSAAAGTDALAIYLYAVGAEVDEVLAARRALEEFAAEVAPARLRPADADALRELVAREVSGRRHDHRELHQLVAVATGNPAVAFFVEVLNRATRLYLPADSRVQGDDRATSTTAHVAIVDAVLAGDGGLARGRMRKHLAAEVAFVHARRPSRRHLLGLTADADRSGKRAEQTAAALLLEIALAGWPIGGLLGSEAELMERYDVSRAVLREAVRVLEHHQVAEMRRGPGGGLVVTQPGVAAIADAVALQVDRLGLTAEDLFEVRPAVEMAVLDAVLERGPGDEVRERLQAALDAEAGATPAELSVVGHDLHHVLARLSGNRVLELVVLVLLRLSRAHLPATDPTGADEGVSEHVRRVHRQLVESVLAGDAAAARTRLARHLRSMVPFAYRG